MGNQCRAVDDANAFILISYQFEQYHTINVCIKHGKRQLTTPPVSIERSDWLKQEGCLNARAAEQNSPAKFVEYWIAVQARVDTNDVVKAKTPSAIG